MHQKNRLLREAYLLLVGIGYGLIRPMGYPEHRADVIKLTDRIAKNLKITPATEV